MPKTKLTAFALRLALFLTPLLAFCIAVYVAFARFPMYFYDGEYAMFKQQGDYVNNNTEYNRIVISGDSKIKAGIIPNVISDDMYNIALGGITPIENYYYLKEYFENHGTPETVILSYGAHHFKVIETFWSRSVYFHRIDNSDLEELIKTSYEYDDAKEITDNSEKLSLQYRFYSVSKYGKALLNSLGKDRIEINDDMYRYVQSNRGRGYFGTMESCDSLGYEATFDSFKPLKIIDYYFRKTIDMCLDKGVNVIVETLPLNEATYNACSNSFLDDYNNYMNEIQKDYPNITVNSSMWYLDNGLFGDSAHLNQRGAEEYSKYIKEKYPEILK